MFDLKDRGLLLIEGSRDANLEAHRSGFRCRGKRPTLNCQPAILDLNQPRSFRLSPNLQALTWQDVAGPGMTWQSGPVFIAEDDFNLAGFNGEVPGPRGLGGSRFQHPFGCSRPGTQCTQGLGYILKLWSGSRTSQPTVDGRDTWDAGFMH